MGKKKSGRLRYTSRTPAALCVVAVVRFPSGGPDFAQAPHADPVRPSSRCPAELAGDGGPLTSGGKALASRSGSHAGRPGHERHGQGEMHPYRV